MDKTEDVRDIESGLQLQSAMKITECERLNLKRMIREQGVEDQTANILHLKHSDLIARDLLKLQHILLENGGNDNDINSNDNDSKYKYITEIAESQCSFLFNNYTDIFRRACKRELDMKIMSQFLFILKQIEDNKCDFHEASLMIGKLLKQLFIDSALRNATPSSSSSSGSGAGSGAGAGQGLVPGSENIEIPAKNITWKEYKNVHLE